ncbi:MAG: glycosyltransferase [Candidatus Gastranaerophilales bacterium]|nr:glycosyltransferase [Candidatus Gastranaerophilales bacterium]
MTKVSVIIPVYNSEKYLAECLESIVSQSLKDIEIICVDDGSTDKSPGILNKYSLKDNRVILLNQKNSAQSEARNRGLEIAKGDYIYFLDSDDYVEQNMLEECVKILDSTNAGFVCFNTEIIGDDSSRLFKRAKKYSQLKFSGLLSLNGEVRDTLNVYLWNKVFRSNIIKEHTLRFPPKLCYEDISFTKSYFLFVEKAYFDMRRFYHYRIHDESVMAKNYKSKTAILDHFRNWHEILKNFSADRELFLKNKDTLEKWFWDYYFMTGTLLKSAVDNDLEILKVQYFDEFNEIYEKYR